MHKRILVLLIVLLYFTTPGSGQIADGPFEVPSKYISVILVPDPNCPLQLQEPTRVLAWSYGGIRVGYTLQNVSTADIASIYFEETNWFGSSGYSGGGPIREGMRFSPLMTYSTFNDSYVPAPLLDDVSAKRVRFTNLSNKFWVAMIVKVKLSDGRTYDVTKNFKELEAFLRTQEIDIATPEVELKAAERRLRDYVATLMKAQPSP